MRNEQRTGVRSQGSGIRDCCSNDDIASVMYSVNMNYEIRTKTPSFRAILLFCSLFLASCSNPLQPPLLPVDSGDTVYEEIAPGMGRITIVQDEGTGRTLLPNVPVFASYTLSFEYQGGGSVSKENETVMALPVSVDLLAGSWIITVTANTSITGVEGLMDGNYPAARGSVTVTVVSGESVPVAVDLHNGTGLSGQGVLEYDIGLPDDGVAAARLRILRMNISEAAVVNLQENASGTLVLDSGYYFLQIQITTGRVRSRTQLLHIYSGHTTVAAGDAWNFNLEDGVFLNVAELAEYLAAASVNTLDNPYPIKMMIDLQDFGGIFNVLNGRYIHLDLSGTTGSLPASVNITSPNRDRLVMVTLPQHLTVIPDNTFRNCTNLVLDIPAALQSIGANAFLGCSNYRTSMDFSGFANLISIDMTGYTELTNLNLSNSGITSIDLSMNTALESFDFSGCSSLHTVILPRGLAAIDDNAFQNCTSLELLAVRASLPPLMGVQALADAHADLQIKAGGNIGVYKTAPGWSSYAERISILPLSNANEVGMYLAGQLDGNSTDNLSPLVMDVQLSDVNWHTILMAINTAGKYVDLNLSLCTRSAGNTGGLRSDGTFDPVPSNPAGKDRIISITLPLEAAGIIDGTNNLDTRAFNHFANLAIFNGPGLTSIGSFAFRNITSLSEVTLPAGFVTIGENAFNGCTGLSEIVLPEGLISIGGGAFANCTSLTAITLPASLTSIGGSAFSGASSLESINIPVGVISIGGGAFWGCTSLTDITLPAGITSIGNNTFQDCTSLSEIILPAALTSIGERAFWGCTSLVSITIPAGVTSIGMQAFVDCRSLTAITLPASLTSIGTNAFSSCTNLNLVSSYRTNAPSAGTAIFGNTHSSLQIWVPQASVTAYRNAAGWNTYAPRINAMPVSADIEAFLSGQEGGLSENDPVYLQLNLELTESAWLDILAAIQAVGKYVALDLFFSTRSGSNTGGGLLSDGTFDPLAAVTTGKDKIVSIEIPDAATGITGSFAGFTNLTLVTSYDTMPPALGINAFQGTHSNLQILVPGSSVNTYKDTSNWSLYADRVSAMQIYNVNDIATHLIRQMGGTLNDPVDLSMNLQLTDAAWRGILGAVSAIGKFVTLELSDCTRSGSNSGGGLRSDGMFDALFQVAGKERIVSIVPPNMTTNILTSGTASSFSFFENLKYIDISGTGITSIGGFAFQNCTSLSEIILPEGLTSIGVAAFRGCTNLVSINISAGVTSIGDNAFNGCTSLSEITLPESLTSIAGNAFAGCTNLSSFVLTGTGPWNAIEGGRALALDTELRIYPSASGNITLSAGITSIGVSAFNGAAGLTAITLPAGLISIGNNAFQNCTNLTSVIMSAGLTSIGNNAFQNCTSLTSVTLPAGLASIGNFAFQNCTSLTEITLPASLTSIGGINSSEGGAFSGCTNLVSINIPAGITRIPASTFQDCTSLTNVTLPEGLISIGNYSFQNCTSLREITLPASLTFIGTSIWNGIGTFSGCTSLESITIPAGITAIHDSTFRDCTSLANVTLPAGLTSIGNNAFQNCTSLTEITLPAGLTSIGSAFNGCTSLGEITLPESLVTIGGSAFQGCTSLSQIVLPEGLASIGDNAFNGCTSLTAVTLPVGLTSIGAGAFRGCTSLTAITLPDGILSIGDSTFQNCTSLTSITLPEGLTSIGTRAFSGCTNLSAIILPSSLTHIYNFAFENCTSLSAITLPASLIYIGRIVETGISGNGGAFMGCTSLESIIIPVGITAIPNDTFRDCTNLTSVTLPAGLTSIGERAFRDCTNLSSINLPASLTFIDHGAFQNCTSLTSITLPAGLTYIGSGYVNGGIFSGCTSLESINIPAGITDIPRSTFENCTSLSSITLPSNLTSIGDFAFRGCGSLSVVTLPASLTSIGERGFEGCYPIILTIYATTPPSRVGGSTFSNYGYGLEIRVPAASVNTYRNTPGWNLYAGRIYAIE